MPVTLRLKPALPVMLAIYLFTMGSVSLTYAYICYNVSLHGSTTKVSAFTSFSKGLTEYKNFDRQWGRGWGSRLFSNYLAHFFVPAGKDMHQFSKGVGQWCALWFGLCCLIYVFCKRAWWLYLVFGTFAALCYGFTPPSFLRMYPWDMPAIFFYALIYLFVGQRRPWPVIFCVIIGTGFKETVAVCSVVFLFWQTLSWHKRGLYTALVLRSLS